MRDPWAEDVEVVSSENVAFGVESAGLGSRFAAAGIDLLIQGMCIGLMAAFVSWSLDLIEIDSWSPATRNLAQAGGALFAFVVLWGYYFLFEWRWDGQTPGKKALGLRVLHLDGSPLSLYGALVRNLLRIFDFLPMFYGAGAIVALLSPNNRRAGDLVAGTVVAREKHDATRQVLGIGAAADAFLASAQRPLATTGQSSTATVQATTATAPGASTSVANSGYGAPEIVVDTFEAAPDLETLALRSRLKAGDWEMALDFARRRNTLTPAVRARLVGRLSQQLATKAGIDPGPDAEAFVMRVAAEAAQQSARV